MKNRSGLTESVPKEINGKTYYSCIKKIGKITTCLSSAYIYECDLCTHAIDRFGKLANTYDDGEFLKRKLYCPFAECPYKKEFEKRAAFKRKLIFDAQKKNESAMAELHEIAKEAGK